MIEKVFVWVGSSEDPVCVGLLNRATLCLVCPLGVFRYPDFDFVIGGVWFDV